LKGDDDASVLVNNGKFNIRRTDIDINTFTWGMPRNELEVHAAIPSEQYIEVMMCRCKDMEVKSQKLQRFSISNWCKL